MPATVSDHARGWPFAGYAAFARLALRLRPSA
jgi:hypothetical protein